MAARAVVAFGRLNPPTMGHEYLVVRLNQLARKQGGIPQLYLSYSQDPKTDPLSYAKKLAYCEQAFGDVVQRTACHTIIEVMQRLEKHGFLHVVYVAGQDRVYEFDKLLQQYNHKEYRFESITVVSAGQRDPDAPGVAGMSASKLRLAAAANDMQLFISGCPSQLPRAEKMRMFHDVRAGMELKEGSTVPAWIDQREADQPDLVGLVAGDEEPRNVDEIFEIDPEPIFKKLKRALTHA